MLAFIQNSQIANVVDAVPYGADAAAYLPIIDGTLPTLTTAYSSIVERPISEWTIGVSQVTRTFAEYIPSAPDQAAIQAARDVLPMLPKRKKVMEILRDALAAETEPDFTPAGVSTSAIALPSHITGSGLNQSQVDARVVAGITGKADSGHHHDSIYAAISHAHTGTYQPLAAVLTGTSASFTTALETKLGGIAAGATANATDANLRDRTTHTGKDFTVVTVAPTAGGTQTFNVVGADQLLALTHSATIAAQTLVFPSNANSQVGQILRVSARAAVTAVTLTLNGNTIYGLNLTTLAANGSVAWMKIGTSLWSRI